MTIGKVIDKIVDLYGVRAKFPRFVSGPSFDNYWYLLFVRAACHQHQHKYHALPRHLLLIKKKCRCHHETNNRPSMHPIRWTSQAWTRHAESSKR